MVNHVTEEQRSPAGWIRGQMGTKLREAVLSHISEEDLQVLALAEAWRKGMVRARAMTLNDAHFPSSLPGTSGKNAFEINHFHVLRARTGDKHGAWGARGERKCI
jgi:hypothetical protein